MKLRINLTGLTAVLFSVFCLCVVVKSAPADPFIPGAYLWTQAYDGDIKGSAGGGTGDWNSYKSWLGVSSLAVESDGGWGDWYDCSQHVNWNAPWGTMQQRHGAALPLVILGIGQMPWDPTSSDSWDKKLAWENKTWQLEAAGDPATLALLGEAYEKSGDAAQAKAYYQKVLELNNHNPANAFARPTQRGRRHGQPHHLR